MRILAVKITVAGALALLLCAVRAEESTAPERGVFADRIVALIDEAPLYESDLTVAEALGRVDPLPGESREDVRRRLLEQMIDERLRYAAVRRQGYEQLNLAEIERQIRALVERAGGAEQLRRTLAEAGMDVDLLREMVARQLVVWDFVENRLGARVFVDLEEIEAYYNGELTTEMAQTGEPVRPLREVRESIRDLLYQRKLNEELERWTAELRFQADISVYLE